MLAKIKCWWTGGHDVRTFPCSEPALTYCIKCYALWGEDGKPFNGDDA